MLQFVSLLLLVAGANPGPPDQVEAVLQFCLRPYIPMTASPELDVKRLLLNRKIIDSTINQPRVAALPALRGIANPGRWLEQRLRVQIDEKAMMLRWR
jgi:hypothetical protein